MAQTDGEGEREEYIVILGRKTQAGVALKHNLGIGILLPERLSPPRFVTIAASNYHDTVEYPINQEARAKLQAPGLTTEEFHRVCRELTSVPLEPKGRY